MRTELLAAAAALSLLTGTALAEGTQRSQSNSGLSNQTTAGSSQSGTSATGTSGTSSSAATSQPMTRESASMLLNKDVMGPNNEKIGQVKDIILDSQTGHAKQAVLDLTDGDKDVAVPITALQMQAGQSGQGGVMLRNHTKQQVQAMSAFTYDSSTVSLNRSGSSTSGSGSSSQSPGSRSSTSSGASSPGAAGTSSGGQAR